jgi:hypothetical protein
MENLVIVEGIHDTLDALHKGDTYFYDSTDKYTITKLMIRDIFCIKSTSNFVNFSEKLHGNIFINIQYGKIADDEFFHLIKNDKIKTLYIHKSSLRNHLVRKQEVYCYILKNYPEYLI